MVWVPRSRVVGFALMFFPVSLLTKDRRWGVGGQSLRATRPAGSVYDSWVFVDIVRIAWYGVYFWEGRVG